VLEKKLSNDVDEVAKTVTLIISEENNQRITYLIKIRELVQQKRKDKR